MRWHQLIRLERRGVRLAADVNAAVTVNQLEPGAAMNVASASDARVVQDSRFAHMRSAARSRPNTSRRTEMANDVEFTALSSDELAELTGEQLPERAAMSLVTANIAIPINAAIAANVLSDNATAIADATQGTPIAQIA
jgi:hypothetical protein